MKQVRTSAETFLFSICLSCFVCLTLASSAQAAVYTIAADGSGCEAIGAWDAATTTCVLNRDITVGPSEDAIELAGNNVGVDGAGHALTGSYTGGAPDGSDGVFVNGRSIAEVKNLTIKNFVSGVRFYGSIGGQINGNRITDCQTAIYLTQGADNNQALYNTVAYNGVGVYIWNSNSNLILANNFFDSYTDHAWVGGTSINNAFNFIGFGNYWEDFDTPAEGCVNTVFDGWCDAPYVFTGGTDPAPFFLREQVNRFDWTWYDNVGGDNWVLLADRPGSTTNLLYDLRVAGYAQSLASIPGYGAGYVTPGSVIYNKYAGLMNGPVTGAARWSPAEVVSSQRILWPKGGNSLEEVPGAKFSSADSTYYWPWYDMASPGFKNWVLVSNPNNFQIHFNVVIGNEVVLADEIIPARGQSNKTFPGKMGGPVRVNAWNDGGDRSYIMASQRVLSNGDMAFNEVAGQADSTLASDYVWPWYDMTPGIKNWVLIANPTIAGDPVTYDVYFDILIDGTNFQSGGPIPPGGSVTPSFPGTLGGPVEVKTWSNAGHSIAAKSIASQRVTWGPSFEEMMGADMGTLNSEYDWTWYDQFSPGAFNWVVVANPSDSDTITATVSFTDQASGTPQSASQDLSPGGRWTPVFNNMMGGPVHVDAHLKGVPATSRNVITSQRVLWNGYFNEVWGQ